MDKFEARLGTIEERTTDEIKNSVSSMKSEILESLQTNLEGLVDSRTKEIEDRKRRETNLVFFNVPEHRNPRGEGNKLQDIDDIQRLSSSLGLGNLQITHCFRLGKKSSTTNRPLKLVLEMKSQKQFLLDNAKLVPEKAPMSLRQVIIVRDMTIKQREERRARRRNRGRNEEADIQNIAQDLNSQNAMEMDQGQAQAISPILGNRNFQNQSLSYLNIHSSTTVFEDTTITGSRIDPHPFSDTTDTSENTVIGGLDQDARSTSSVPSEF